MLVRGLGRGWLGFSKIVFGIIKKDAAKWPRLVEAPGWGMDEKTNGADPEGLRRSYYSIEAL